MIEPYFKYPQLADLVLNGVKIEQVPSMRLEVIKVLGILGALDPYKYKMNQLHQRRVQPCLSLVIQVNVSL